MCFAYMISLKTDLLKTHAEKSKFLTSITHFELVPGAGWRRRRALELCVAQS
jgi:hypothetical protein